MSKAVITIEDDEGKTKINVEFDPPLKDGQHNSPEQWIAVETLKFMMRFMEQHGEIHSTTANNELTP